MSATNRIDQRFRTLGAAQRGALVPYITAGYPDLATTEAMVRAFDASGVPILEFGIPYSDPIADGPVIQESFHRVLQCGFHVEELFGLVARVRGDVSLAMLAMVSYSIVVRFGLQDFVTRAAVCGLDGLVVPDLPVEESSALADLLADAGLKLVGLVAPTTSTERRAHIARAATGFVYQIAATGVTGERQSLPAALDQQVRALRTVCPLPICVGFGISSAAQVRRVCTVADGAIVGSAVVRRITAALDAGRKRVVTEVVNLVDELLTGTKA